MKINYPRILVYAALAGVSAGVWSVTIYLLLHHALLFAVLFTLSALWLLWCVDRAPVISEPPIRRACMICKAPLDDGPPILDDSVVSHGVCEHCAQVWIASQRFTPEQISTILKSHFK
jgi:hypothetical protein